MEHTPPITTHGPCSLFVSVNFPTRRIYNSLTIVTHLIHTDEKLSREILMPIFTLPGYVSPKPQMKHKNLPISGDTDK